MKITKTMKVIVILREVLLRCDFFVVLFIVTEAQSKNNVASPRMKFVCELNSLIYVIQPGHFCFVRFNVYFLY